MARTSLVFFLGLHLCTFMPAFGMEPLAFLAAQPAWQAGEPIPVNVDYDGALLIVIADAEIGRVVLCSPSFWYN